MGIGTPPVISPLTSRFPRISSARGTEWGHRILIHALTTRTAGDFGTELAAAFRNACVALLGLGIIAGMAHGPFAGDLVIALGIAGALLGGAVGALYLVARWAFNAAWSSVQSDARRTAHTPR